MRVGREGQGSPRRGALAPAIEVVTAAGIRVRRSQLRPVPRAGGWGFSQKRLEGVFSCSFTRPRGYLAAFRPPQVPEPDLIRQRCRAQQ